MKKFLIYAFVMPICMSCSHTAKHADATAPLSDGTTPATIAFENTEVTLNDIAQELGLTREQIERQAKLLAFTIQTKSTIALPCGETPDSSMSNLCSMSEFLSFTETDTSSKSPSHKRQKRYTLKAAEVPNLQKMSYSQLSAKLYNVPPQKIVFFSGNIKSTEECPRNLSAVAARKLEEMLPSPMALLEINSLYEHAQTCMTPQDEGYELLHLRAGLLKMRTGDLEGAKAAFEKAALTTSPIEPSRILYWAGKVQTDEAKKNSYWDELLKKYPLTFHALKVWEERASDPLAYLEKQPAVKPSRQMPQNQKIHSAVRWVEALYIVGEPHSAQKLWADVLAKFSETIPESVLVYMASLKSKTGNHRNTIYYLSREISKNPSLLSKQTLQLLYPLPYWDVIQKDTKNIDPYLIISVARQESSFQERARSRANAQGLLQLLPGTARRLSGKRKNNLYDPAINFALGDKFLAQLVNRFGSVELALAGYNAGPLRVDEWLARYSGEQDLLFFDLIPFRETRNYVTSIIRNNYWYERLYTTSSDRTTATEKIRSALVKQLIAAHNLSTQTEAATGIKVTEQPTAEVSK